MLGPRWTRTKIKYSVELFFELKYKNDSTTVCELCDNDISRGTVVNRPFLFHIVNFVCNQSLQQIHIHIHLDWIREKHSGRKWILAGSITSQIRINELICT